MSTTSNRGRNFMGYAAGAVALSVSALLLFKETYLIENYLNFIRVYKNGLPMEVPEDLEQKIDACVDKAKFRVRESTYLKSFMVSGFDTRSVGSINSTCSGYIGIPLNYLYKSINDIDKINHKVGKESIDWTSEYGQLLEKSMVLTEDEKDFGLLKAAFELRNQNFIHQSLIPGASIFALYVTSQTINEKLGLYQKPRTLRLFAYTILGTFVYGMYSVISDMIRIRQDIHVDRSLAKLGPEMCETGVHFYDKLMNKNVALRELCGDYSTYTDKGNENPRWFGWFKLALSTRKVYFKHELDEARKKKAEEAEKAAEQSNETEDKMEE